jgi:acyl carrier protein
MNKSEVIDQIKTLIANELDANLTVAEIGEADSLFEDGLGLDSVAIVEFITILEDRFEVMFSDTDLTSEMFRNISTIADFVLQKKAS